MMKKSPKVLRYFGLNYGTLGFLEILYSPAVLKRSLVDLLTFLETSLAEKIVVCAH
jgi:hypothetical protein